MVRNLIETGKYFYANGTDKVVGGPFTRIDPSDPSRKSLLDVIILSQSLEKHLSKLTIDDNYDYPMQHPIKVNGKYEMKKSDHLTLVLDLIDLPTSDAPDKMPKKESCWNYNKKGGWERYRALTENKCVEVIDSSD